MNSIKNIEDTNNPEKWKTVWFSQWEPADKKTQWAHSCYINRFGKCFDVNGVDTTNSDINAVDKATVPNHNLLVGGFPCQDYSVASSLATSKGLEGKKGVLWWDIRDMLEAKAAPFVLLENVDRLIKSPAKQRGQSHADFIAKMSISLKEASETEYWISLMMDTGYISTEKAQPLLKDVEELTKILVSIVKSAEKRKGVKYET